jgi:hypothetical protein
MSMPKGSGGLCFRNIELFNLALLALQVWRILQDPGSLSARVLKADYFPTGELLDAEVGSSPYRVWRAIVDGVQVLQQGLVKVKQQKFGSHHGFPGMACCSRYDQRRITRCNGSLSLLINPHGVGTDNF